MKRIGIIRITYESLENILEIQKDHHIVGIVSNIMDIQNRIVRFIVKGPLMPLQHDNYEEIIVVPFEDIKDIIKGVN